MDLNKMKEEKDKAEEEITKILQEFSEKYRVSLELDIEKDLFGVLDGESYPILKANLTVKI